MEESMLDNLSKEERYEKARKRVKAKLDFFRHFITYIVVIGFLFIVNNMTYSGYQWWPWPALGWGIGIISHFLSVFMTLGGSSLEERLMNKEMDRMDD